ncbi:lysozyme [Pseudomonas viridiflava]|uniref:lysozyme n=1 Tax=Pseudomonas viridiflava TaxID=33069 RepID=UPI000F030E90|nr:lysozyme [Pseudomonas viridiflava]
MNLLKRTVAAAAVVLAAAGFTLGQAGLPPEVERAAIIGSLMVMTPELEGTRLKAYPDTGGVWTICTGHTGGVKQGDKATHPECAAYLRDDLVGSVDYVMAKVPTAPLLCKVSYADMAFNAGRSALGKSSMISFAAAGDYAASSHAFMRWVYVAGKDCRLKGSNCAGIITRRELQRDLCLEALK